MTQLPQDEFETCLEKAEAWMKEIHKRLKVNDNTQGPRSALESRLRETEAIRSLEPDGKLLVDMVLIKAETLLSESSEDEKHDIHVKLGKLKAMFDETTTYMTHCHSRIEWVWLHWNEYLKARDEFTLWVHNITLTLEPALELQLGLKEKGWQHDQALVLLRDVNNQSRLLDRLLEEAGSLYNRIGDPSVDESVQGAMMAEYKQIKKKAQERVTRLEKIWKDHEAYEVDVTHFKSWLNSVIEKLKCCIGGSDDSAENRLNILREIGKDVESGDKQLQVLELESAEVIKDTSPLGAEKLSKELEELRRTLAELKLMNDEEEENLLKTHNSESAFLHLAQQLEANIKEFRKAIQRLEESLQCRERVKSEEDLIALWKTLNVTKSALAAEEAKAERVKVQLKDLFKFSKDVQPLSDGVIAAMREYQRAKSKAFKLSTDTESELRQIFQNPLREYLYWKRITESVLDATAVPVNDGDMNHDSVTQIEKLLEESSDIKDKFSALEKKKDRIHNILGDDRTRTLLTDVTAAEKERAGLHQDLLERKNHLQSLAARMKEFDSLFKQLRKKLAALRVQAAKENELQPDIIGKEAQLQRLQLLLDDLTRLYPPIKELNAITESNPTQAHRANQLSSDYLTLQRSLENNIRKCKTNISNHWMFNNTLLELQRWIMVMRQDLESYQDGSNDRNRGDRNIEALISEVSEKDIQRHLVEAQGQLVMESSSPEGSAVIQAEIKQLNESWAVLTQLCAQLSRTLKEGELQGGATGHWSPVTMNQTSGSVHHDEDTLRVGDQGDQNHNGVTSNQGHHPSRGSGEARSSHGTEQSDRSSGFNIQTPGWEHSDSADAIDAFSHSDAGETDNGGTVIKRPQGSGDARRSDSSDTFKITTAGKSDFGFTGRGRGSGPSPFRPMGSDHRTSSPAKPPSSTRSPAVTAGTSSSSDRGGHEPNIQPANFKLSPSRTKLRTGSSSPENGTGSPATSAKSVRNSGGVEVGVTSGVSAEDTCKDKGTPNYTGAWGVSRRNRKVISLAESVDVVESPKKNTSGQKAAEDHMTLLTEFQQWLQAENAKLSRIYSVDASSAAGLQTRQSALQKLQSRVPEGQKLFESLLLCRPHMKITEDLRLEDLRYRWMLYKSKLRDSGNHANLRLSEEPRGITKKSGGLCSFLHRVCCAALPLQLLLLLLLLLAFLLPLLYETQNCALSNNFARSFNLMLKYDRPPPT